jgi:hypothetical protein
MLASLGDPYTRFLSPEEVSILYTAYKITRAHTKIKDEGKGKHEKRCGFFSNKRRHLTKCKNCVLIVACRHCLLSIGTKPELPGRSTV